MSSFTRKPVFGISDKVQHKPGCTATEHGYAWLRKKTDCTIYVAKTKALISCAVTVQLIYTFVFAYGRSRFSHDEVDKTDTSCNCFLLFGTRIDPFQPNVA